MLEIRQENKKDYAEVYNVIKKAFMSAEHCDGNEQDLVVNLRESNKFIPELSLAPLAVLPEYQKQGVGSKLIEEGHKIAKKLGYHFSVVLGSEKYYPKFGYVPAVQYEIEAPFEVSSKNFMAKKLNNIDTEIKGVVKYAKEFGI